MNNAANATTRTAFAPPHLQYTPSPLHSLQVYKQQGSIPPQPTTPLTSLLLPQPAVNPNASLPAAIQSGQHIVTSSMASQLIPESSDSMASQASIWQQESVRTRKHEGLIWQLLTLPKDRLVAKGDILICMDSNFVIGRR